MSLLDAASVAPRTGSTCWARKLPDDLAEEMRDVEDAYDKGVEINQKALSEALKTRGVDISDVGRHLRGECKCRS